MNFNVASTDPLQINEEIKLWVDLARKEVKTHSIEKSLLYNFDFSKDRPIHNTYSRLTWDLEPLVSFKLGVRRSSSASQARGSSLSTNVAFDFELMETTLPFISPNSIEISEEIPEPVRVSHPYCLRERLGSDPSHAFILKSFSRSKSY